MRSPDAQQSSPARWYLSCNCVYRLQKTKITATIEKIIRRHIAVATSSLCALLWGDHVGKVHFEKLFCHYLFSERSSVAVSLDALL